MTIRAVFFDAIGTAIHPDPPAMIVYAEVGKRYGSRLTPLEIKARFWKAFAAEEQADWQNQLRTSEEREAARWRKIVGEVLDDVTDAEACFQELFAHFSQPNAWRCDPDIGQVLRVLHARGYVLGMASNYDKRLHSVVAGLPELGPIEHLVISSEVGWRKPARAFFEELCRVAGCAAAEILFVGDDEANDYGGAQAVMMQAILHDPAGQADSSQKKTVTRLAQIPVLIEEVP